MFDKIKSGTIVYFNKLIERRCIYYDISSSYPESMRKGFTRPFTPSPRPLDNLAHVRVRRGRVSFIPASGMCPAQRRPQPAKLVMSTMYGVFGKRP